MPSFIGMLKIIPLIGGAASPRSISRRIARARLCRARMGDHASCSSARARLSRARLRDHASRRTRARL